MHFTWSKKTIVIRVSLNLTSFILYKKYVKNIFIVVNLCTNPFAKTMLLMLLLLAHVDNSWPISLAVLGHYSRKV